MTAHIDDLTFVNESGRKALQHIANELVHGDVVLFAGPQLSLMAPARDGSIRRMPAWTEIVSGLAAELGQRETVDTDPLRVADYYQTAFGRSALVGAVKGAIADEQFEPGRVHELITQLKFTEIISTTYDTLLQRAFQSHGFTPEVVVHGRDLARRRQSPRIVKMNGCLELDPAGMVITADDADVRLHRDPVMEAFVTNTFVESQVLFLGFGLGDPMFRAINERALQSLGSQCPLAFSLQVGSSLTQAGYWRKRQVQVVDLMSGKPQSLNAEERLYRVLDALLQTQRELSLPTQEAGGRLSNAEPLAAESTVSSPSAESAGSFNVRFDVPRDVDVACRQYLTYFEQFLWDVGIDARANVSSDAGQILFSIVPQARFDALEQIYEALRVYLALPARRLVDVPDDIATQRLVANVRHLEAQLALAKASLLAQHATIEAQATTIDLQRRLGADLLVQSARPDREEILGGLAALTKYERAGLELNLAEMWRRLKRRYGKPP